MKQIYTIALFFLPVWGFSQLNILPYGNKESFVFVEKQLLYVEKGINLKLNPGAAPMASLYLRDEAQLIQGDETIKNSGNGLLSVFQEGRATAFTYNYWSPPVQNASADPSFGNIFFEPLSKTNSRKAQVTFNLNGSANPLKISSRWIFKLAGQQYEDWVHIGNNFNLLPGEGFTLKGVEGTNTAVQLYGVYNNPGNEQRYDFRGIPHTGTISLEIKKEEIKLIGNPYPSALDLDRFLKENTNTTGIAYFWDSSPVPSHYLEDYEGGYGAYSPVLGSSGYVPPIFKKYDSRGNPNSETGYAGQFYARKYSPIGQGFIVEGLKDGTILFKNNYRVFQRKNSGNSQFKSLVGQNLFEPDIPFLRLQVEFNDLYVRELLLALHPEATTAANRAMDARNLSPLENDAGWAIEDNFYLIAVKPPQSFKEIPLIISTTTVNTIKFKLAGLRNFNNSIYLYDSETEIYYNLKEQEVNFTIPQGELSSRFYITFDVPEIIDLIAVDPKEDNPNIYLIFQNNPLQRTEIITPENTFVEKISIWDIMGRKIREVPGAKNENFHNISTENLSKGIYIIKILSSEGTIISKKVIISNN